MRTNDLRNAFSREADTGIHVAEIIARQYKLSRQCDAYGLLLFLRRIWVISVLSIRFLFKGSGEKVRTRAYAFRQYFQSLHTADAICNL